MRKPTIAHLSLETASLRHDAREAIAVVYGHSRALRDGADLLFEAELSHALDASELRRIATRVRCTVAHSLMVLSELQARAGRLEQIAAVLEASGE